MMFQRLGTEELVFTALAPGLLRFARWSTRFLKTRMEYLDLNDLVATYSATIAKISTLEGRVGSLTTYP